MKYWIFVAALIYSACAPPEEQGTLANAHPEALQGTWLMGTVFEDTSNVTDFHNPGLNRWISLQDEGVFESGGTPYGYNSGQWAFDSTSHELYLDSDAGEEDDSYWIVSINADTMRWQGARNEFAERFTIRFKKNEEK